MSYEEFRPHPALRAHVDRIWVSASRGPLAPRPILPDGCVDVLVDRLRGEARVVGAMTRAVTIDEREPTCTVAVRFRPGGASPFLGVPTDELTDRVESRDAVGLRWLEPGALAGDADHVGAARALERQLLATLARVEAPHAVVAFAARSLFRADPPSVAELAAHTGWTRQHLNRMFLRHVGVGPKMLARVARLQRAVAQLQERSAAHGLADAALRVGYFDQAHMALDFRTLAGIAPSAVAAGRGTIFPIASLLEEAWGEP